jgi:hypothetical protein
MPVILAEEHHEAWLSNQAGKEVLVPFPAAFRKSAGFLRDNMQYSQNIPSTNVILA